MGPSSKSAINPQSVAAKFLHKNSLYIFQKSSAGEAMSTPLSPPEFISESRCTHTARAMQTPAGAGLSPRGTGASSLPAKSYYFL